MPDEVKQLRERFFGEQDLSFRHARGGQKQAVGNFCLLRKRDQHDVTLGGVSPAKCGSTVFGVAVAPFLTISRNRPWAKEIQSIGKSFS